MNAKNSKFNEIDKKKAFIDGKRPFPKHTAKRLNEKILVEWTYNTNAIEGNTLTLSETRVVLEGITVGGKTIKEHLEAINHRDAVIYLEDIVKGNENLSEWVIKNLHGIVLRDIDRENAGVYRKENVVISGATHIPPDFLHVPWHMEKLIKWYYGEGQGMHPIERAAVLHTDFVKIHPFVDGNGRTARLLLNFELMKNGYPPAIIKKDIRPLYYEALDIAHTKGEYGLFTDIVVKALGDSLDLYIKVLGLREKNMEL